MRALLCLVLALAAGAALAPTVPAQDKPWNVSASLRGFYDDNYTTVGKGAAGGKLSSFGFEISPSVSYRLRLDPTEVTASYKYGMRYFEDFTPGQVIDMGPCRVSKAATARAGEKRMEISLDESTIRAICASECNKFRRTNSPAKAKLPWHGAVSFR